MSPPQGRSPIAIGFEWATRITMAALALVVPMLAGIGVDRVARSAPWGLFGGLAIGLVLGMIQLIRVARDSTKM